MNFNHINRRTHLYLAMVLLPWFLFYGVSALFFSHHDLVGQFYEGRKDTVPTFDKTIPLELDPGADKLARRAFAASVLKREGIDCSFGVSEVRDGKLDIWCATFRRQMHLVYHVPNRRLTAEESRFRVDHFFTQVHARSGFEQDRVLDDVWAIVVDIVSLGFFIWVASGIYMWWKLPRLRLWGAVALISGVVTFSAFMWRL